MRPSRIAPPAALEALQSLGREIEATWLEAGYAESKFPDIAAEALGRLALEAFPALEIVRWALNTTELPRQSDPEATFGNPPLTVFNGREFFIDLLFWVDGTTSVHQHSFSGAFRVASGSSLHGQMRFEPTREMSSRMRLGRLTMTAVERLVRGDTRPIHSGDRFIHSLFHLDRPSVTIVVRTREDRQALPQYEYHFPGLGLDPFYRPQWLTRQVQLLQLLLATEEAAFSGMMAEAMSAADPFSAYRLLNSVRRRVGPQLLAELVGPVRDRDRDFGDMLAAVFEADQAREFIADRRHQIWDADQRYFLAVLMNVQTRAAALELALAYRPDQDPVDSVVSWIETLASVKSVVHFGGGAWQPNPFGLSPLDESDRTTLARVLRGGPWAGDAPPVLAALDRSPAFRVLLSS